MAERGITRGRHLFERHIHAHAGTARAEDPAIRFLRTWESQSPCPPPETATEHNDPRIATAARILDLQDRLFSSMKAMVPVSPTAPMECQNFMGYDFKAQLFGSFFRIPDYNDWLLEKAGLRRVIDFRNRGNDNRCFDVSCDEVRRKPLSAIARLYDFLDERFTEEARNPMIARRTAPRDKHGRRTYDPAGLGIDQNLLKQRCRFYATRFDIDQETPILS